MVKVSNDYRVDKLIRSLPEEDNSRIVSVIELFSRVGFNLSALYLKKLTSKIWELRSDNWRVLFGIAEDQAIIVNVFKKKTQKTPKKELDLAEKRIKNYL